MKILLLAVIAGGCFAPRAERPYPPPTAGALLGALRHRAAGVRSMRGEARIDHRGEAGRVGAAVLIAVRRPASLRLDALSPFGSPVASLATDGRTVGFFDRDSGRFMRGPAKACSLLTLVQLPLGPDDAVEVLLGGVPLLDGDAEVSWDGRAVREVVRIRHTSGAAQEVRLSGRLGAWTARESEIREGDGRLRWRVEHEDWRSVGGVAMPKHTRVTDGRRADVRIRYREQDVNVELPDKIFATGAPPGVPVEDADCD